MKAGRFHLESQLPGDGLYVRAMALPGPAPAKQNSAVQNGFSIRQGEQLSGLTINVAEGAASIRGKVTPSAEGGFLPPRLRVHLVPADREQAENVLRYGEAVAQADGSFTLTNIAPGRYWLVARAPGDAESNETTPRPASWDAASRAALRREGEAAGAALELSLCQRVADHALRYAPVAQKPPAKKTE